MKNVISEEKARKKKRLSEDIANTTTLAKVTQASSSIDFARKYIWVMSNANLDVAKKLRLTNIKKY